MTLQAIQGGCTIYPSAFVGNPRLTQALSVGNVGTMDAATEKVAFVGHVFWDGAPASPKTMGASSKVHFRTNASTISDAGTTVRVGLQDVQTSGTTFSTPDGTFDVYADVAGNSGLITSNAWNSVTLSTSGSKSVAHSDQIAIVLDMTARGGADSLVIAGLNGAAAWSTPGALNNTGTWAVASAVPICAMEADDGTIGVLVGAPPVSTVSTYTYQASTNPDERGLIFQVPFKCKINGVWAVKGSANANADSTLRLYSTPLGTPASMTSATLLGEQANNSTTGKSVFFPLTEQTLEPGTDYCVAFEATGTSAINITYATVTAGHRAVMGLENCRAGDRNNLTGAFNETTTEIPLIALSISALSDDAGGGGLALPVVRAR